METAAEALKQESRRSLLLDQLLQGLDERRRGPGSGRHIHEQLRRS